MRLKRFHFGALPDLLDEVADSLQHWAESEGRVLLGCCTASEAVLVSLVHLGWDPTFAASMAKPAPQERA